jgi:IclR family transcriptional regulator, pca regulon regulatory protein
VSVLDGDDLVYVGRVHARKIMKAAITVGTRYPAYPTSMGRVLLAHASPRGASVPARVRPDR